MITVTAEPDLFSNRYKISVLFAIEAKPKAQHFDLFTLDNVENVVNMHIVREIQSVLMRMLVDTSNWAYTQQEQKHRDCVREFACISMPQTDIAAFLYELKNIIIDEFRRSVISYTHLRQKCENTLSKLTKIEVKYTFNTQVEAGYANAENAEKNQKIQSFASS